MITPTVAVVDPNVAYGKGSLGTISLTTYVVTDTVAGTWHYTVTAPGAPHPLPFELYLVSNNPLALQAFAPQWSPYGSPVVITASLAHATTPLVDAVVGATITRPDGRESSVHLRDDGVAPDDRVGDGVHEARPYLCTAQALFAVGSRDAALNGSYADWPEDADGDGDGLLYEYLVVDVGVEVSAAGAYLVSAVLKGSDGQFIDLANATTGPGTGTQTLALRFSGRAIHEAGIDGPYTIAQVLLVDEGGATLKLDQAHDAWVTAAYDHRRFGDVQRVLLPVVLKNHR